MDEVLLSKIRLSIVTELLAAEWISFAELQRSIDVTAGNLTTHLGKLVAAEYVQEEKRFVGRRPNTRYRLTPHGRDALLAHVAYLNDVVRGSTAPERSGAVTVPGRVPTRREALP
jgi:DNA-binding HxlR family transcriptional regulator